MKYVALLRGIGPGNPNMHGAKLAGVLEDLGFSGAVPVISSGNVIFESDSKDIAKMEEKIQAAWPKMLGFKSATIIRSQEQLQALVDKDPYKGAEHSRTSYQLVTFFKQPPVPAPDSPNYYVALGVNALCSTLDTTAAKTPDFMTRLDRQYDKDQITSRTWLTIHRILAKMEK